MDNKYTKITWISFAGVAVITLLFCGWLFAQTETEDEEQECKWIFHTDQITSSGAGAGAGAAVANTYSSPQVQVQIQTTSWVTSGGYLLNECDGSIYRVDGSSSVNVR